MKKIFLFLTLSLAMVAMATGCKPKDHHATPVANDFMVPEVADVVLYQVNPRVFAPSNSLQAIIGRLDSIQDLGVNMLWIMPIYPIGQEKSKNSPYSVRDYKAVAPTCGCWFSHVTSAGWASFSTGWLTTQRGTTSGSRSTPTGTPMTRQATSSSRRVPTGPTLPT